MVLRTTPIKLPRFHRLPISAEWEIQYHQVCVTSVWNVWRVKWVERVSWNDDPETIYVNIYQKSMGLQELGTLEPSSCQPTFLLRCCIRSSKTFLLFVPQLLVVVRMFVRTKCHCWVVRSSRLTFSRAFDSNWNLRLLGRMCKRHSSFESSDDPMNYLRGFTEGGRKSFPGWNG